MPEPNKPPEKTRLIQLDILRGLAIMLVIGRHVYLQPQNAGSLGRWTRYWFELGWTGVDLFFVLSGFLVGGLLFKEWRLNSSLDVKRFLIRRGFKIWPPYLIYIVFATAWYVVMGTFGSAKSALLLMLPNFLHLQSYVLTPLPHTWSLAIEEHFYLALPFVLLICINRSAGPGRAIKLFLLSCTITVSLLLAAHFGLRAFLPVESMPGDMKIYLEPYFNLKFLAFFSFQLATIFAVVFFAPLAVRTDGSKPSALPVVALCIMALCVIFRVATIWKAAELGANWTFTFFASHLRVDSLLFGVLLGYLYHFKPEKLEQLAKYKLLLLAVGILSACYFVLNPIPGPLSQTVFSLLYLGYGLILLAIFYIDSDSRMGWAILNSPPGRMLSFIGYYSYSIYLWHINPARAYFENIFIEWLTPKVSVEARWLIATPIYVVAVILLGVVMAKVIETPSLMVRDRLYPRRADALNK